MGPKLSSIEIAKYLKIPERAVQICIANVMPSDVFETDEKPKLAQSNSTGAFDTVISLMQFETNKMGSDKSMQSSDLKKITSNLVNKLQLTTKKGKEDLIAITFDRWIEYCKNEWYEKLNDQLEIQIQDVTIKDLIDDLYSIKKFTDDRHEAVMSAIDRELRFKKKVEPLQISFPSLQYFPPFMNYPYNSTKPLDATVSRSYYSKVVTMENFRILLEDILKTAESTDATEGDGKMIQVQRSKYISMCENEWYQLALEILDIPVIALQPLDILLSNLYSPDTFTDEKHKQMLDAIYRELRFKNATEKLVIYATIDGMQYSYYSSTVTVKNFELVLEDILKVECPAKYDDVN